MSYISVNVLIKPYLKDFLLHINGREDADGEKTVVVASKKNITGHYLFPLLQKTPPGWKPLSGQLDRLLTIELPYLEEFNIRCNNYVSEIGMRHFQSAIENIFLAEFYREVTQQLNQDSSTKIKDAILDFCYAYEISFDNITYEMLRKKYTRYRMASKEKRKVYRQLQKRYRRINDRVA